jgi:hypothetical protein
MWKFIWENVDDFIGLGVIFLLIGGILYERRKAAMREAAEKKHDFYKEGKGE